MTNKEDNSVPKLVKELLQNPDAALRERVRRSLYAFVQYFWDAIIPDEPKWNWHIPYLCYELQKVAHRVFNNLPKEYDLLINIPPGTTKSTILTQMFPAWCWLPGNMPYAQFIAGSYSGDLSMHHGSLCRDLITSDKYIALFPELTLRDERGSKSDFQINYKGDAAGSRTATSVGGTLTGKHGHFLLVDDPINPQASLSQTALRSANNWMEQTLSTRKIDKDVSVTILIMQRLSQGDPAGVWLQKRDNQNKRVYHICLPGELGLYKPFVNPPQLVQHYEDDLLDPTRMSKLTLREMLIDLGQYGYAGQIGQNPTPPGGGMFQVDKITIVERPTGRITGKIVRYWDKAGSDGAGAYTAGVKMTKLENGRYCILDIQRGQWSTDKRESVIKQTAEIDSHKVYIYMEQEPGSSGKDSIYFSAKSLDGFVVRPDKPSGDKVMRADPFSVQVNFGNVEMVRGAWNQAALDELRFFPVGMYKDQVDAMSGAYKALSKPTVGVW